MSPHATHFPKWKWLAIRVLQVNVARLELGDIYQGFVVLNRKK
jgi:hypothetical protein